MVGFQCIFHAEHDAVGRFSRSTLIFEYQDCEELFMLTPEWFSNLNSGNELEVTIVRIPSAR